eukprot:11109981-Lingulodinium_polyedra.AAC.1
MQAGGGGPGPPRGGGGQQEAGAEAGDVTFESPAARVAPGNPVSSPFGTVGQACVGGRGRRESQIWRPA